MSVSWFALLSYKYLSIPTARKGSCWDYKWCSLIRLVTFPMYFHLVVTLSKQTNRLYFYRGSYKRSNIFDSRYRIHLNRPNWLLTLYKFVDMSIKCLGIDVTMHQVNQTSQWIHRRNNLRNNWVWDLQSSNNTTIILAKGKNWAQSCVDVIPEALLVTKNLQR